MNEFTAAIGTPEAREVLICADPRLACETYIFEPSPAEVALGRLYAVGETEDRGGVGKELLDMTIQALQREYYRDPTRGITASFESALHQANIVLHDAAEQGVRDWMGYWHVAVGVVAETSLHISTAGNGLIFLVRKSKATLLTEDLSYSPITDPLRTFSQVASGTLAARDVLYLGTAAFSQVFRREDLLRFSIEHSAQTISTRLQQLYADQQSTVPLVAMVISILPNHIATARPTHITDTTAPQRRERHQPHLMAPRQPIVIHRTALRALVALTARIAVTSGRWAKERLWPLLLYGSQKSGRAVVSAGAFARRNVEAATVQGMSRWRQRGQGATSVVATSRPHLSMQERWQHLLRWLVALPRTSKIFAGIAVVLALILVASIFFLQSKRAADTTIQQASETLHTAQTQLAAAETALIYDNRDQARTLLREASDDAKTLLDQNVYVDEAHQVQTAIAVMQDRLQKVLRASSAKTRVVGDFKPLVDTQQPGGLTLVDGRLFSFNPATNEVFSMTDTGETAVVSGTSEGIGALRLAVPHVADKNIVFITDTPGVAVFDTKLSTLSPQDITWPADIGEVASAAVYGSRLYIAAPAAKNIYSYNKTLRGYSGGTPWITTKDFPADGIVSITVDGTIYTLHSDGSVRQLFKGEEAPFTLESVDPPLAGAKKILTYEGGKNIYIFDPAHQRIVVYTKDGALVQQVIVDVASTLTDLAVAPDETTLYALDGTQVLAIPLGSEQ